jgi:elongation factor P--(R)-beta-lysine ligase
MRPVAARVPIRRAIVGFLEQEGLIAVETPALQVSGGLEPHLAAMPAAVQGQRRFLHTSPEFAMKRLVVREQRSLYQFVPVYRDEPASATHHPAFEMLEWYRVGQGIGCLIEDCLQILRRARHAAGGGGMLVEWAGERCDLAADPEVISCAQAFHRFAGINLARVAGDREAFAAAAYAQAGVASDPQDSWEDIFFRVLLNRIEPWLGLGQPTFLTGYPREQAALARMDPSQPAEAERVELYVCGMELANGFGELTDAFEQRQRFNRDQAEKQRLYGQSYPLPESMLTALEQGMPRTSGMALGFDRLVMLATGARRIDQVLWLTME